MTDSLRNVTRITVVGPDGIAFERYGLYESGVELHLQDSGRTLKIFPLKRGDQTKEGN